MDGAPARRFPLTDVRTWQWQALRLAAATSPFVAYFQNNGLAYPHGPFPNQLAVGEAAVIDLSKPARTPTDLFDGLTEAARRHLNVYGYIGYDVKNQLEFLRSRNPDRLGFPDASFFEPHTIYEFDPTGVTIRTRQGDPDDVFERLTAPENLPVPDANANYKPFREKPLAIRCRVTPDEYQANVRRIQQDIRAGDVYELNYCVEFFAEQADLDPLTTYQALNERSPMPFSTFLKIGDRYVMGASPERFLKKEGRRLIAQPIKGTIRRGRTPDEDARLRTELFHSEKERAENLMIVDLVRNDLARSAETGSVRVEELFGIYGFQQVYQMISTVSATLQKDVSGTDALRYAFPMGSMTGAPKIRAMERIDELEVSRRGVYSGAVGFVTPDGDFDFSVVIRTLLYNAQSRYASFSVGSAITYDADPAQEWEECLLKARAIREVLEGQP